MKIEIGKMYKMISGRKIITILILAIIDEKQIVYKYRNTAMQHWMYDIRHCDDLKISGI